MCDRGFHGSSSSSSTLGARGPIYLKEVRTPPGTMQLKNVSPCIGWAYVFLLFFVEPSTVYLLSRYPNSSVR